jgi:Predicted nucleotide-binding protein containing TIR-like domain
MKPRIFIGSSSESLPVVDALVKGLEAEAEVVRWDAESNFPPGEFFLAWLLKQAHLFDFAIMVFGPDDQVTSRDQEMSAPRDNVVFELGLFMSQIDRLRALVVAPSGAGIRLKWLSDLGGLAPASYTPPADPKDSAALAAALGPAIRKILKRIQEQGPKPVGEAAAYQGAKDVLDVFSAIEELIQETLARQQQATVRNIGLDMELTWGPIESRFLTPDQVKNLTWRSLIIDPESPVIQAVASDSVDTGTAAVQISKIRRRGRALKDALAARGVTFECKASPVTPVVHGFLVNETVLFLSLTRTGADGRLGGGGNAYWRFLRRPEHEATSHFFHVFSDWFDYAWSAGRNVWPE